MSRQISVILVLLLQIVLIAGLSQSPARSQSSAGFDWRDFLADPPTPSSEVGNRPASPSLKQIAGKKAFLPEANQQISGDIAPLRETEKDVGVTDQLLKYHDKKRRRNSSREIAERHKQKLRETIGFSSTRAARLHYFRQLERIGKIDSKQQQTLDRDREKKRKWKRAADEKKALQCQQELYESRKAPNGKEI